MRERELFGGLLVSEKFMVENAGEFIDTEDLTILLDGRAQPY